MKSLIVLLLCTSCLYAQIGINTNDPKGTLDVTSVNNTGLVLPRVTSVEDVTDGNSNPPLNGTVVFDLSRGTTCFYQNSEWMCITYDTTGNVGLTNVSYIEPPSFNYIKASNTQDNDQFGYSVSLSGNGNTMAVRARGEDSNATGINGNQNDNSSSASGAVYVFIRTGTSWIQQAYIKASNTDPSDLFGRAVTLSSDGNTLAVGANEEDSNATGINGNQNDNSNNRSGAVYLFTRIGTTWSQQAYIKASNTEVGDQFGESITLSGDGNTMAIGASFEDSNATGINGNQNDNSNNRSGAVYLFTRTGTTWSQQAYVKASNSETDDQFGKSIAISGDGNTMAVGAYREESNATGINGDQNDNSNFNSGALYIFTRTGTTWTQQTYIKASNAEAGDEFGFSVSLSGDGNTMAVGAWFEDSNATNINGDQNNNSNNRSGAVYVFTRTGTTWTQQAYIKASNSETDDIFGFCILLSSDGNTLAVGASFEDSNATSINGDQNDNSSSLSGAVYVFTRTGTTWSQQAYVKASNTDANDQFGHSVSLSGDGKTLAVGAYLEDSNATGINGDQNDNNAADSGAVYIYTGF